MSIPPRITALAALLSASVVLLAPVAAFASDAPDGSGGFTPAPVSPTVVITHSSPAWLFVLVALGAAVITAVALLAVEHYRHGHTAPTPA